MFKSLLRIWISKNFFDRQHRRNFWGPHFWESHNGAAQTPERELLSEISTVEISTVLPTQIFEKFCKFPIDPWFWNFHTTPCYFFRLESISCENAVLHRFLAFFSKVELGIQKSLKMRLFFPKKIFLQTNARKRVFVQLSSEKIQNVFQDLKNLLLGEISGPEISTVLPAKSVEILLFLRLFLEFFVDWRIRCAGYFPLDPLRYQIVSQRTQKSLC